MVLNKPDSTVTAVQLRNGRWAFVLKYRGVTYPAQGQFPTEVAAKAFGEGALKVLEAQR
jgi:hypothetical protein